MFKNETPEALFYYKMLIAFFLPFLIGFINLVYYWIVINRKEKQRREERIRDNIEVGELDNTND